MKSKVILLFLIATALGPAQDAEKAKRAANSVGLDELAIKNLGIQTVEAEEKDFEETVFALGLIDVMPGKSAVVSSRIAGRAEKVIGKVDTKCEAGDELLSVESRQHGDPPPVIRINAPISGIIAKVNVSQGKPVSPDDSLMEIYDLGAVHAVAGVPEHLAGKLAENLPAEIRVAGFPDKVWKATLEHLGATADTASGTVEASFHVPNEEYLLRPGMKAEFSIIIGKREGVMSVPRDALKGIRPVASFTFATTNSRTCSSKRRWPPVRKLSRLWK